jgi:hypothetical protein
MLIGRCVAALAGATLAGCGANYATFVSTGGAQVASPSVLGAPPGLSVTIGLSETAGNIIAGAGMLAILAAGNNVSPFPPPRMKEDRTINEQDCTQPITNFSANLKCK